MDNPRALPKYLKRFRYFDEVITRDFRLPRFVVSVCTGAYAYSLGSLSRSQFLFYRESGARFLSSISFAILSAHLFSERGIWVKV